MTDNLREKAEALVRQIEISAAKEEDTFMTNLGGAGLLKTTEAFKRLKASLRPSREEIADFLEEYTKTVLFYEEESKKRKFFQYAIEELRKKIK